MREYIFRNSKQKYFGIPVIAANMDTTGTFEMALALYQVGGIVTLKPHSIILTSIALSVHCHTQTLHIGGMADICSEKPKLFGGSYKDHSFILYCNYFSIWLSALVVEKQIIKRQRAFWLLFQI